MGWVCLKHTIMHILHTNRIESAGNAAVCDIPDHPNVLKEDVVRRGLTLSRLYDESLHRYWSMDVRKTFTRDDLVVVMKAVAKALSHMHAHGIGHFDVKPSNVLIKWHTRGIFAGAMVVLADFGLCKSLRKGSRTHVRTRSRCSHVVGTHTCH